MAQKMSFCMQRDDTKLSLPIDFSLINWNCHVTALCFVLFWCGLCFLVCFCAFCFPLFLWCLALFPG